MEASGSKGRVEGLFTSTGGVPKHYAFVANILGDRVEGDDHNWKTGHGGPDRAVCIFSSEIIEALRGEGHPVFPGSTGENIDVSGLEWVAIVPGTRLRIGHVLLEITRYTTPCKTIRPSFIDGYSNRISHKLFPGWSRVYARVLATGQIRVGDEVIAEQPAT